ncbi:hypothetical protein DSLASN_16500 [Desulfoluna limicola]|uniref:Transposase n=1 Tax=Desulfoluna limicola TaxID=2810562 RepID=A0ABN6F202_9BACT|nr:hypothetical protein DSLASN_16500 [Desulfoluna limicola]
MIGEKKGRASGGKVSHLESWFANAIRVIYFNPCRIRIRATSEDMHGVPQAQKVWVIRFHNSLPHNFL